MTGYVAPSGGPYEIEPELRGAMPRRVRERRSVAALQRFLTRAVVFQVCFLCWLASRSLTMENAWLHHQRSAVGTVIGKSASHGGDDTIYDLRCTFQSPIRVVSGEMRVGEERYLQTVEGNAITIFYRDDNLYDWRKTPVTRDTIREVQSNWYFGIVCDALACTAGLWALKAYRRSRLRLLREGSPAVAVVTKRRTQKGDDSTIYLLSYRWLDPQGHTHSDEICVSPEEYRRYGENACFTVLCDPINVYRGVPYFRITEAEVIG